VAKQLAAKLPKRYQWVTLYDYLCAVQETDYRACSAEENEDFPASTINIDTGAVLSTFPRAWRFELVPPVEPSASNVPSDVYAKDTCTIVAMKGDITLCPVRNVSPTARAAIASQPNQGPLLIGQDLQRMAFVMRAALSKDRYVYDSATNAYLPPERDPLRTEEWADAQFMKQWERRFMSRQAAQGWVTTGEATLGCYGNVSAAAAGAPANTLSSGSGTVNIPAISTTAADCSSDPNQWGHSSYGPISEPGCIRIPLTMRRRLTFKENEGLNLWFNWTGHFNPLYGLAEPNAEDVVPVTFRARATLKALMEVA